MQKLQILRLISTLSIALILALTGAVEAARVEKERQSTIEYETAQEALQKPVEKIKKPVSKPKALTLEQKIDTKANKCTASQYVSAEDASCIDKLEPVAETVGNVAARTTPQTASQEQVKAWIRQYAPVQGLSVERMLRVAECESTFGADLINESYYAGGGNPGGIYQYLPETWSRISGRSPYGIGDRMNHELNIKVTMWAWANGYSGEWECQ